MSPTRIHAVDRVQGLRDHAVRGCRHRGGKVGQHLEHPLVAENVVEVAESTEKVRCVVQAQANPVRVAVRARRRPGGAGSAHAASPEVT